MLLGMQPLKPGDVLARYRLERPLGAGGMGSVWLAVQEGLGRRVALKVMHPAIALDPSLAARFRQEAEVAASFNHPGIVPVTDFGVDGGRPFLVMDFLEGESLDAILAREAPLPPERVAFFAIQILAALEALHARNIVHRDLKPDNVFVSASSGVPDIARLLDFGIARVVERDGDAKMTTTGQILGTPAYMSPEQAKGMPVTTSSDLYALGVVMYEALSGRPPFEAENYHQLLFTIVEGNAPKLGALCPNVDEAFVALVERSMAPRASDRFQGAMEMREALAPFAAMDVLRASGSHKAALSSKPQSDTDPLAATMTPQEMTPLAFDATALPGSVPGAVPIGGAASSDTDAAGPAAQSMRPEPPRRSWAPLVGLFALGALGAGAFAAFQPGDEGVEVAAVPETLAAPPVEAVEAVEPEPIQPAEPIAEVAPVEEVAENAAETETPVDNSEPPTTMGATMASSMRTGAPPSHGGMNSHAAMHAAAMQAAAMDATAMNTTSHAGLPASRMGNCQQGPREMFLIRPPYSVYITGGSGGAGLGREFFARVRTKGDSMARCFRGQYMDLGQDVNVTFDANGSVTDVSLRPYCPMPAEVERCVASIVRTLDFSDLNPTAGVARFGFGIRGR